MLNFATTGTMWVNFYDAIHVLYVSMKFRWELELENEEDFPALVPDLVREDKQTKAALFPKINGFHFWI